MKKQELYQFLRAKDIVFEITEHKAVYNMAEVAKIGTPHPGADAKNIFVRDDKKHNYYLSGECSFLLIKSSILKELLSECIRMTIRQRYGLK